MGVIIKFRCHRRPGSRHSPAGDGAGGGSRRWRRDDDPPAEHVEFSADVYRRDDGIQRDDLEIEKKWLLLARTDLEHFGLFFDKYRGPLLSFIQHRVGDWHTAEDLLSETFLEAVDGLWRFRFQGVTFGAWLYRLARRRIAKHFDRRERRREIAFATDDHDVPIPSTVQVGLEEDQDRQLLALAVRQLDSVSQEIVILYYWEYFSLAQIAAILGASEANTKARLHRARRKLASLLEAPEIRCRLTREGRRALDELRLDIGRMRLIEGYEDPQEGGDGREDP